MNKKGFTLIEILAVIVILSLVIVIVSTKGFGAFDKTKKTITEENLKTIKESANILATQIENCNDDVDSELWNDDDDNNLSTMNEISDDKKNCNGLKEKMSSSECITVTVRYLIQNNYLSEHKDFDDLKNDNIKLCKITIDSKKEQVIVDTTEIEDKEEIKEIIKNDKKELTLSQTIRKNATIAAQNNDSKKTIMGNEVTKFKGPSTNNEHVLNKAPDDYGTSYYFRGEVIDNYVEFGKYKSDVYLGSGNKMYSSLDECKTNSSNRICTKIQKSGEPILWSIIRINGDDTVRLFLPIDVMFGQMKNYAEENCGMDNACLGYMYGTPGSTTYEATHENKNDSNAKTIIDKWYEDNLYDTKFENYLADTLFCGDKTVSEGTGIAKQATVYSNFDRNNQSNKEITSTLECAKGASNNYSRYTVKSYKTIKKTETNGNLKYPVAMLSADEAMMAGNQNVYHFVNGISCPSSSDNSNTCSFNTMSPGKGVINLLSDNGSGNTFNPVINIITPDNKSYYVSVYFGYPLNPVINLKSDVIVESGDGTKDNPYKLKLN